MQGVHFAGELARLQQNLAATRAMAERRRAVIDTLAPNRGERVIELGCGAGLLLREIGLALGPHGLATGIDISPDQAAAARAACREAPAVMAETGDMTALARPDAVFDAAVSVEALEHVPDTDAALAEILRVLKPGGRVLCLSTNWHSAFWHGADPALTGRITAAWDSHLAHPNLPARLPARLAAHGFAGIRQLPVPVVDPRLEPQSYAWWIARLMVAHAEAAGLAGHDGTAWLAALEAAEARGEFFFSMVPILTVAHRADRDAARGGPHAVT